MKLLIFLLVLIAVGYFVYWRRRASTLRKANVERRRRRLEDQLAWDRMLADVHARESRPPIG